MAKSFTNDFCATSKEEYGENKQNSIDVCEDDKCNEQEQEGSKQTRQNENIRSLEERLQDLRKKIYETKVQLKLLQKIRQNSQVTEFLNEHVFYPGYEREDDNNVTGSCLSQEEQKHIRQMLKEKAELNDKAELISKKNKDLEAEVFKKKLHLKKCMKERKVLWSNAVKKLEHEKPDISTAENLETCDHAIVMKNKVIDVNAEIEAKITRISEISRILQLLVSSSGVKWTSDSHLLEVVLCTGKLLNCGFDNNHSSQLKIIVDDVLHRLNCVKI